MHKPDLKLVAHEQDKRSVVPIELADVDHWLAGSQADAEELLRLTPAQVLVAGPQFSVTMPDTNIEHPQLKVRQQSDGH